MQMAGILRRKIALRRLDIKKKLTGIEKRSLFSNNADSALRKYLAFSQASWNCIRRPYGVVSWRNSRLIRSFTDVVLLLMCSRTKKQK